MQDLDRQCILFAIENPVYEVPREDILCRRWVEELDIIELLKSGSSLVPNKYCYYPLDRNDMLQREKLVLEPEDQNFNQLLNSTENIIIFLIRESQNVYLLVGITNTSMQSWAATYFLFFSSLLIDFRRKRLFPPSSKTAVFNQL